MMNRITLLVLAMMFTSTVWAATPSGQNSPYKVQTDTLDYGGQAAANGVYSQIGSVGGIEGISDSVTVSVGHGYVAQIQTTESNPPPVLNVANLITSYSASAQGFALSATLVPVTGTVDEGTVTFQVVDNATLIGSAVTAMVSNNVATGIFALPAGQAPKTYTINARFSGGPTYFASTSTGALVVNRAVATVTFDNLLFIFSGNSNIVTATTSPPGLAYTLTYDGVTYAANKGPIGSSTQDTNLTVVATIQEANYTGGNTGMMTIKSAGGGPIVTTIASDPATVQRSPVAQVVSLTATVSPTGGNGAVNEGTVMFMITDSMNVTVGSPVTSSTVTNGNVRVNYGLPAALALGTYTITASYSGTANFLSSSDNSHQMSVTKIIGGIVPNVRIDSISRNPARTNVPVNIVATGTTFFGQPLTYTWSLYTNGQATTQLRVATPAIGQSDTLTTTFPTEGAFTVGVVVDDGYNTDSGAAVTIIAERLKPNDDAKTGEINIATGQNDRPSVGANIFDIQIGDSLQGVIDADLLSRGANVRAVNAGAFCIDISGRANKCIDNPNTAFKFTHNEAEIFVIQATDKVSAEVLGQRMVAISQDEIEANPAITQPDDRSINVKSLKAAFNFTAKKRVDTMAMSFSFKAPGGVGYGDSHAPIVLMGIGNVILKFQMSASGKGSHQPTSPGQSPVATQKATLGVTGLPKKPLVLTVKNQIANATLNMSGANLVDNGFKFLGITNTATTVAQPVMVECLMIFDGVSYRKTILAQYTNPKGKGTLTFKQ